MAATATAPSTGPRYAPEDPTLPKPWKGLVDGKTGYLYFWNPETNVTQYERPVSNPPSGSSQHSSHPKSASVSLSSSVQVHKSSGFSVHGQEKHRNTYDEDTRSGSRNTYDEDTRSGSRNTYDEDTRSGSRNHQHQGGKGSSAPSQSIANGSGSSGRGASDSFSQGPSSQTLRSSARGNGSSDKGSGTSVESYRRQHEITITGVDVPAPFMSFESTGFPSEILREVHHAGFSAPTPIQAQSWPIALQSRDIVAIAKTGSGKTLGYLIPGFIHLKRTRKNSQMGPTVLVLSPTRELATQIQDEAAKFGKSSRISCTCLYGGAPKGPQLRDIDRGVDVVVATPGRLNDILEMRRISLRQVSYLVLDEADRMLDMGFEPQIRKIVKEIPARRQTLMYTATWPKEVRKIAADLLVNPVQVNIGKIDELVANKSITQYIEVVKPTDKQRRLEQILRSQEPGSKVIIFCSTKRMCDQLARTMTRQFGAAAIHGDKSQGERDYVLNQFRSGRSPILVATDVAARGLDIKDIRVVINFDFPTGIEDYVHRIGRTGRAGATGLAYTFFCDQDSKYASDLVKVLEGASQRVPPEIRDMASRGGMGRARRQWGSGPSGRDGGRSLGAGRSDSSFGGWGGRGPPSSGRSDRGRGNSDRGEPRDRYDQGSYHDNHVNDTRGKYDRGFPPSSNDRRGADRDTGRSRSPSPNKGHGWAHSRSPTPDKGHGWTHNQSRSRSRSRSLDRFGGGPPARGRSPLSKWDSSPAARRSPEPDHSPPSTYQQQRGSPYDGEPARPWSPPNGREANAWGSSPINVDEEEEGMIPADEEGMIPADD